METCSEEMKFRPILVGRSSSSFTRIARFYAAELGVEYEFRQVDDLLSLERADYCGNPALKVPVLELSPERHLFGSLNICRWFEEVSASEKRCLWPEDLKGISERSACETTTQALSTSVSLILAGAQIGRDNPYVEKVHRSLSNSLLWLDRWIAGEERLPCDSSTVNFLEVSLYCLYRHLEFREVLALDDFRAIAGFCEAVDDRAGAKATPYGFDASSSFR